MDVRTSFLSDGCFTDADPGGLSRPGGQRGPRTVERELSE